MLQTGLCHRADAVGRAQAEQRRGSEREASGHRRRDGRRPCPDCAPGRRAIARNCRPALHRAEDSGRQAKPERHLAGHELGALGPRASLGGRRHPAGARASSRATPFPTSRRRPRRRRRTTRTGPRSIRSTSASCRVFPRITYIPFPFQIAQTPKYVVDQLRVPARDADHLHRRQPPCAPERLLDGRLARALGEGHAGRGRHALQRSDLVRHGRELSQRRAARGRAVHAARRPAT